MKSKIKRILFGKTFKNTINNVLIFAKNKDIDFILR